MPFPKKDREPFFEGFEGHLRLLVESSPEGMVICDEEDRIVFANPEFCRMFGWERTEVIGRPVNKIVASSRDVIEEASLVSSTVLSTPHIIPDTFRTRRDGSKIPVSLMAGPITDGDRTVGVYGIYRDISRNKKVEAEVRREKAFFENLFQNAPEAIVLCDRQERVINANRAFTSLFGYTMEEMEGLDLNLFIANDPELIKEARDIDDLIWSTNKPFSKDTFRTSKDGSRIPVKILQFPFRVDDDTMVDYTIYRDRRSEVLAENALRREKAFFEGLFEACPDAIILSSREGRIIRVNSAFFKLFGYSSEDRIIGEDIFSIVTKDPASEVEARELEERFWKGHKVDLDVVRQKKDGTSIHLHLTQAPFEHEDGSVIDYMIYRNIENRKKAEKALRESEQRFLHIVEDQDDFIIRFTPEGVLTFANSAYCRRFGKKREEIFGRSIYDHVDRAEAERLNKENFAKLTPENPTNTDESWALLPDGQVRLEQWQNRGIFDETGNLVCVQSVGRDVTEQRKAERALMESERRYAAIVEDQAEMVCRFLPGGEVTFVNDSFCSFFGISREQIISKPLSLLLGTANGEDLREGRDGLSLKEHSLFFEHLCSLPSGKKRWLRWSRRAIFDENGMLKEIQVVGRDFTGMKQNEDELRHLNSVLRSVRGVNRIIFRHSDSEHLVREICAHLIETRGFRNVWIGILGKGGNLARISEAGIGPDGRPLSETTKNGILNEWGLEVLEKPGVTLQRRVMTMTECPLLDRYEEAGIMASRLEYGGKVFGLISVSIPGEVHIDPEEQVLFEELAEDISFALNAIEVGKDREEKSRILEGKAFQLELLTQDHRDGLWEWDVADGRVDLDPGYETMLGYTPGEIKRSLKGWETYVHPEDLPGTLDMIKKAISGESGDLYQMVYRMRTKEGYWQKILNRGCVSLRDSKGRATRIVGTHTLIRDQDPEKEIHR